MLTFLPGMGPVSHYLGWRAMAGRGAGVATRRFATGAAVPSSYHGRTAYGPDGLGNIAWVGGHVTARRSAAINETVRWRPLRDPQQGTEGW